MNQHLHIITLGVRDFKKSFEFYSKILGWKPSPNSNDDIAFFQGGGAAPAAVLGANFDTQVATRKRKIICNVGNFHTLAFRLGDGIEGVFEHHTGEIDLPKLEKYIRALADGSLKHMDIFDDMGHGALVYGDHPFEFGKDDFDVVVTGPRRSMFKTMDDRPSTIHGQSSTVNGRLRPYFATPFGDMMIAGCFGLLAAIAEVMPEVAESINGSLRGGHGRGVAPWDAG